MNVLVTGRLPDNVLALIEKDHHVAINTQDRPMEREAIISNIGDKDGLLCMVTDTIDAGTDFVSASDSGSFDGSTVTWNLPMVMALS